MFEKLQSKWNVGIVQLILILCVFAIGGSLTGYIARIIMPLLSIDNRLLWIIVYLIIVTLLWPLMVILVSFPFGQLQFFRKYIQKLFNRIKPKS